MSNLTAEQAADKIIDLLLGESEWREDPNIETLLKTAGDKLAGKFVFACYFDEDYQSVWIITPIKYWKDDGYVYDQESPIDHLMPANAGDVNGCGTWAIDNDTMDPIERAKYFHDKGFVWEESFQLQIDDSDDAEELIRAMKEKTSPGHLPPSLPPNCSP